MYILEHPLCSTYKASRQSQVLHMHILFLVDVDFAFQYYIGVSEYALR